MQWCWLIKQKVSAKGLEPLTNGLKGHCSTVELRARSEAILSRRGIKDKDEGLA
jgi:hypothetical protein